MATNVSLESEKATLNHDSMILLKASRIRVVVEIDNVVANKPSDGGYKITFGSASDADRALLWALQRGASLFSGTYSVYSEFNSRPVYKVNFNVEIT